MSKLLVDSSVWDNDFNLQTGLTYFFLISNGIKHNKIGCFSIPKKVISFYTDLTLQEIDNSIIKLKSMGLIDYEKNEFYIENFCDAWTCSQQYIKSLYKELETVKSERLKQKIVEKLHLLENKKIKYNKVRDITYQKFDGKCAYCGDKIEYKTFHIDHIIPRKSGGKNDIINYNPSCSKCNLEKSNRTIEEYRFYLDKSMTHKFFFEEN